MASGFTIGFGLQDKRFVDATNEVHVSAIYKHERFQMINNIPAHHDMAMMKLSKPIDISGRSCFD